MTRLAALDERLARVAELRLFADLSSPEISDVLGVNARTVERDWLKARTFLSACLAGRQERAPWPPKNNPVFRMTSSLPARYASRHQAALILRDDGFGTGPCGGLDRLAVFSGNTICRDQSP